MDAKRMEHAVRNMALLAALVGFLGVAPAMPKEVHLAGWIYACARSDQTGAVIPTFTTAIERPSVPRAAERGMTGGVADVDASSQTMTARSLPHRDEFSVWAPNPVVGASLLR
jgi:hypothetical protein